MRIRGYILRPLKAKHLRPTVPEEKDGSTGTSCLILESGRDQQIKLAQEYGITDYPSPAGGCLLTYREYGAKIKDLLKSKKGLSLRSVNLLRIGRHLRLTPQVKIIVGKNEAEKTSFTNWLLKKILFWN